MKHNWIMLLLGASFFVLLTSMKSPVLQADSTELKVEIATTDDLRVQLTAQNETGKKLSITVIMMEPNAYSHTTETEIYTEEIPGDVTKVSRTLNLSKLDSGSYRIKVKAGKQRFDRLINIQTKPVVVPDNSRVISIG